MKRNIVIDCDPGHDDAVALMLLGNKDKFNLLGVSCAAGNQTVDKTSRNAINICEYLGIDVPIAKGSPVGLVQRSMICPEVHGESGLDGFTFPKYEKQLDKRPGAQLIIDCLMNNDDVTVITTGAMTNLALAMRLEPKIIQRIKEIIFMGGSTDNGNVSPAAEFNILVDPESADIEFRSGVPVMMSGLDVTEKAIIYPEEWEKIRELNNPVAKVVAGWLDFFFIHLHDLGFDGATLHDPCAVLALNHPEIFEIKDYYVEIETQGEYCRGATVPDYFGLTGNKPNCKCVLNVDREKFVDLLKHFTFRVTQDEDYLNVLCKGHSKILDLGWNKTAYKNPDFDDKNLKIIHYKINWKPWHYENTLYEEYFWDFAKQTQYYDMLMKMRDDYSDERKQADYDAYISLEQKAIEDTNNPNFYDKNYLNDDKKEFFLVRYIKKMNKIKEIRKLIGIRK